MTEKTMLNNEHTPTISIIIPVYKVEKYLSKCLDSIVAQTFTDWECILIDDGSPDASGKICDEYVQKDPRFVVIHKVNAGVSAARNDGLKKARGKWISFVDSDDTIDEVTYEDALKVAEENNADLVQWGIILETDGKEIRRNSCKEGLLEADDLLEYFEPSTCHKLFSAKIIYDNGIEYPSGLTLSEDRYFSFLFYLHSNRVVGINKCYYHYRIYSESSTHRMSEKNIQDEIKVYSMMEAALNNSARKVDDLFKKILIKQKIEAKNHALFLMEKPNCKLWRELYPEVKPFLLKTNNRKNLLYVLLNLHLDFIVKGIIKLFGR